MLHLYQSNRLETLLELLAAVVEHPQDNPLAPETVIVQSKGMGRWVSMRLAEKHGICANIQFPLPASFLWQLLRSVLGELPGRSEFSPEAMAFRLMDWLSDDNNLSRAPRLANYLHGSEELRRFELASRIAGLFDQYLVYRPDWITAWERGGKLGLGTDEDWQALLWSDMVKSSREPHRSHLVGRLLENVESGEAADRLPERLILFGISSLPPMFLEIIQALSRHLSVALFALNPCRLPWGEIRDSREKAKLAQDLDGQRLYLDEGHPLLASLGKQGREFFDSLLEEQTQVHDLFDEGEAKSSLLGILQTDILDLVERGTVLPPSADPEETPPSETRKTINANDRSLQIHICHSPMREVEVLRDQMLAMLDEDPSLNPSDIAVLTPDISVYAPYIEAVFGAAETAERIPYAIADRGGANEQPLLETFLRLLDLPSSRFEANWVMDFLEQPFIRSRFALAEDDLPAIHTRVRLTGIRWGRDAAHRSELGLPEESRHTWREGLQRLLLGYALPQKAAPDGIPLFGRLLPFDDLEGGMSKTLGQFAEFAETLMDFSLRLKHPLPLAEWADRLAEMLEALFNPTTETETNARTQLLDALDLLRELSELSGFTNPIALPVVKQWLEGQLQSASGGGFLTGGATFGAMVPMRSLPFKIICLLGLNDDAYPRRQHPAGFDLIARHPRRGDRSRRLDDRYLFLETLLSARQTLYISYIGRNIRDNGELPPSVLVADLLDVVDKGFIMEEGGDCRRHIVSVHPLQAFNPAYFRGDPKHPGFSRHWLESARLLGSGGESPSAFFTTPLPEPDEEGLTLDMEGLALFFSNPARYLLRYRMGVVLETGEEEFESREPFSLDYFGKEALRDRVLQELRLSQPANTAFRLAEAAGNLPHDGFGHALFDNEQARVRKAAPTLLPLMQLPVLEPQPFLFKAQDVTLEGVLSGVTPQGLAQWRLQDANPRDIFKLWIKHLALCLIKPPGVELRSLCVFDNKTINLGPVNNAAEEMGKLLGYYRQGLCYPLPFFVKSAFAYVEAEAKKDREAGLGAAHKIWDVPNFRNGNFFGESENPYYQAVYRGTDPLDETFEALSKAIWAPLREAME